MLRSVTDRHAATLAAALVAARGPVVGQTGVVTDSLPPGLYEVLVTEVLAEQLAAIEGRLVATETGVRPAEVADRVALHLGRVVERAIEGITEEDRVDVAIAVARDLVARLDELVAARSRSLDLAPERPVRLRVASTEGLDEAATRRKPRCCSRVGVKMLPRPSSEGYP